jgi:predicted ATPase/transcriptional regulator with XRE-family HTH domain
MPDAPPDPTFAEQLRTHRRAAGLSQAALAHRAEMNPRSIKYLESGSRQPYPDTIQRLAVALGLSDAQRQAFAGAALPNSARRRQATAPPLAPAVAPTPTGPRHNLPAPLTSFVGRDQDRAALQALLGSARLVTLLGPGGIGKTRLALEAVAERLGAYPDGVWLVELAGVADAASVTAAVAGVLERRQQGDLPPAAILPGGMERRRRGERPALAWLTDALRGCRLLLVLDNCEHLVEACAALAEHLLRTCPTVQVLATSREALGVHGEHIVRVPPLHVPSGNAGLSEIWQEPSIQLFMERAAAASGFTLTAQNARAVVEICRRLDGLPLAIELAAGRTSLLTAEEVATRLDDRFRLLTAGARTGPARHQTLRAVVTWSYELMGPARQRLFERLAVFAGGFDLEAACRVANADGPDARAAKAGDAEPETFELLAGLVSQSLVTTEHDGGETRYRLLETLREYAVERLAASGEADAVARRHATYFTELAEASEWGVHGPEQARWVARLLRDHDNLDAALRWSTDHGEVDLALRLVGALSRYWQTRPHRLDAWHWCDRVLALDATGVRPELRARVLIGATARALLGHDLDEARRYCGAGLALHEPLGDSFDHARALMFGGFVASAEGDPARAHDLLQAGLIMCRRLGHRWGEGLARGNLGVLASDLGDLATAEQHLLASAEAFREAGDAFELAVGLAKLGDLSLRQGNLDRALGYYGESLDQYHVAGTAHGDPILLYNQACVLRHQNRRDRAVMLFHQALALHRERGDSAGIANCLLGLADLALTARQTTLAVQLLGSADRLPRRILRGWIWPDEHGAFDAIMSAARATLGEAAFEIAFAEGRALTPEQAVAETSILTEGPGAPTRLRPRRQMA